MTNNQQLLEIIQQNQHTNRWMIAATIASNLSAIIASGLLIWKSFQTDKPSKAVRLIRIEAAQAKLQIEKAAIKKEADHEAELNHMKSGILAEKAGLKDIIPNSLLTDLKNQGESLIKQGTEKIKEPTNKLKG